jgi:chemotaxis protein MotB
MMRKRRRPHVSHDRWLISYADFITLLFAFFVVLYATGESKLKRAELGASIKSAFSQMGIIAPHSKMPSSIEVPGSGGGAAMAAVPALTPAMLDVEQNLEVAAQPEIDRGVIAIHQSSNGLVVSLQEAGFFDSGAAGIRSSALPVLDRIAAVLPESPLRVEGHTDDVQIHNPQFASNWELSSARASSIARLLLLHPNVHAGLMSVAGYAEFHPAASNATAEGRARNRRVDIVLLTETR